MLRKKIKNYDPIIAISTNNFYDGGIGIIRISLGNKNFLFKNILKNISNKKFLFPRIATYSNFYIKKKFLDRGIILYFPSPNSFNGETIIEFHMHGNIFILNKMISFCLKKYKKYGMRNAKKGEFIRRAYLNKKIDIFELKKIYNILNYKKNFKIGKENKFKNIIKITFKLITYLETMSNFIYEKKKKIYNNIKNFYKIIKSFKKYNYNSFLLNKKINICIVGNSNVGKSSLFNIIINKKYSIVNNEKGTTRNCIFYNININKNKIKLFDTFGFKKKKNKTEYKAFKKTKKIINYSDIIIYVFLKKPNFKIIKYFKKKKFILVLNKIDKNKKKKYFKYISISCKKKYGISNLKNNLNKIIKKIKYKKENTLLNLKKINNNFKKIFYFIKKYLNFKIFLDELILNLKIFQNKMCKLFDLKKKSIINNIFKSFCVGK
ncbi:GTPase [Candidatus Vidania fulgoroideorum]